MSLKKSVSTLLYHARMAMVGLLASQLALGSFLAAPLQAAPQTPDAAATVHTDSPIKHLIVLIGENRTFDHLFATYQSPRGEFVSNLLSKGIIHADGTPGPNFGDAAQFQATKPFRSDYFSSLGRHEKDAYGFLPAPTLNFAPAATPGNGNSTPPPPFPTNTPLASLGAIEPSLEMGDLHLLTTGGASAFPQSVIQPDPDTRVFHFNTLPDGPFQLKGDPTDNLLPYDSYTGDTTHRLFEMWQQSDCNIRNSTFSNPSGCLNDLYPFVIVNYTNQMDPATGGIDDNGGGNSMAFYNMHTGDVPVLKALADQYSMSDNYHQAVMGGTGANHVMMGTGDAIFWSDGKGKPTTPPSHIANPNPLPGSDDVYTVDLNFDGNFTECGNSNQPGVDAITDYLASLPYHLKPNCAPKHYYMVNNDNPGFLPNGTVDTVGIGKGNSVPPSDVPTIGEELNKKNISWAYYGGAYNAAVNLANGSKNPLDAIGVAYCNICNFESYTNAIMGNPTQRQAHIKDATDFFAAIQANNLPSVSFVKPDGLLDGHPATSKEDLFEGMVKKIVDSLQAQPSLWATTALMITMDEGGGYYDSGYIQPLDFFGDGPRIPMIVVSPYSSGGHVSHTYTDHVSILKFIERNWDLKPLTERSRDNLPNPFSFFGNPYVPINSPAIGDLFDLFDFGHRY